MILDSGICKIYKLINTAGPGDMPNETKKLAAELWYGELAFESSPVRTTESQEQVEIVMRIRVLYSADIDEKAIIEIAGKDYKVERVFKGIDGDSGERICDLSLSRLESIYDAG